MIVAMFSFAVEDALLKAVLAQLPVAQVLIMFGTGGVLGFCAMASLNRSQIVTPGLFSRPMVIRSICEVSARLFHVMALAVVPLSLVTAILQAAPVLVVAGCAVIFHERVGLLKWTAILLSLVGVGFLLRLDGSQSSAWVFLAILGMLGTVGRDIAARALPHGLSGGTIGIFGFLATAFAGMLAGLWEQQPFVLPDLRTILALLAAVSVGMLAYAGLTRATRAGPAAIVTPFRYTRLIFGLAIGFAIFGETITLSSLLGCGLILLSGIVVLSKAD